MKQLLLFTFFLAFSSLSAQTIYVNAAASGNNDGSTWTDAYTSLDNALDGAADGQSIWVAAGTYTPQSTFSLAGGVNLLGGFNGTETDADQADPTVNLTTLSGDLNGDDNPDQLDENRDDNVRVLDIVTGTAAVTIDGFTFKGGKLDTVPDGSAIDDFSGAAIRTYSPLTVSRCSFSENVADYGAAIAFLGEDMTAGQVMEVSVSNNFGRTRGVIYSESCANIDIRRSSFTGNFSGRGAVYLVFTDNVSVDSCSFRDNSASDRCPAIGYFQCTPGYIGNSEFLDNASEGSGGAVYIYSGDNATRPADPNDYIIENSNFEGNTCRNSGGGIFNLFANSTLRNCSFINNVCDNGEDTRGGAVAYYNDTPARAQIIENCTFTGSRAQTIGAGIYSQNKSDFDISGCTFTDNGSAASDGRSAFCFLGNFDSTEVGTTYRGVINIDDCDFISNQTNGFGGGAIYVQNNIGNVDLNVDDSRFEGNFTFNGDGGWGGAIFVQKSVRSVINNSTFRFNEGRFGGAIFANDEAFDPDFPRDTTSLVITNSRFISNVGTQSAGALYNLGVKFTSINNVFAANTANTFNGGAMYLDFDTLLNGENFLINNTFYGNFAATEDQFADDVLIVERDGAETSITLQNNAFTSEGAAANFEFGGPVEMTSLGGNYYVQEPVQDAPFEDDDVFDIPDEIAELYTDADDDEDPEGRDLRLNPDLDDHPLVDGGTTGDLVPAFDANDFERDATPDIGAYEAGSFELRTIAEIVATSPIHSTLEILLDGTGLMATLENDGPYTLFAPTDAAFTALSLETFELISQPENIDNTLLTHLIGEEIRFADITDGAVFPSLAPMTNLQFATEGSGATVTTSQSAVASILIADQLASNGVVHIIDAVLVPAIVAVNNLDASGIDVTFFPNPVQNQMNVSVNDPELSDIGVSVINLNGQRISQWSVGNGNNLIDFTSLPAGSYTLEIVIDGQLYSKQIVKQ